LTRSKKAFAVHPGEILKTEFMEPMGVSAYALDKALNFPSFYEVARGDRAITPIQLFAWGSISACQRSSGSIYRTTTI
jgi:hypothetical protein